MVASATGRSTNVMCSCQVTQSIVTTVQVSCRVYSV